jgi:uncharacterized protein (TIGR03067 family)
MSSFLATPLFLALAVLSSAAFEGQDSTGPSAKDDDARLLQGKWRVVSARQNGASFPKTKSEKMFVVIDNDEIRVFIEGQAAEQAAKFTINTSTNPKQIDFTRETRDREWGGTSAKLFRPWRLDGKPLTAEDQVQGIYKLDGDALTLCWRTTKGKEVRPDGISHEFQVRPSLFRSDFYYLQFLFVLARAKAE